MKKSRQVDMLPHIAPQLVVSVFAKSMILKLTCHFSSSYSYNNDDDRCLGDEIWDHFVDDGSGTILRKYNGMSLYYLLSFLLTDYKRSDRPIDCLIIDQSIIN